MMSEILNALVTLLAVVLTALAFKGAWLIVQDKEAEFKARKKEAKKYDK